MIKVNWELEEAVALFDLYFRHGGGAGISDGELTALSEAYQRRAGQLGLSVDEKFRNLAGLRMQLACAQYVVTGGQRGLSAASRLFYQTYELYRENPACFQEVKDRFYQKYKEPCKPMRAIVTVIGRDQVGIIAAVCALLSEKNVNVLDISQTVLQEYFTMIMLVDASQSTVPFARLREDLAQAGQERNLDIRVQREDIFDAMHRI